LNIDFKTCSEEELWRYVGSHLNAAGIDAVLVGGAVVSVYSAGAYRSGDLDFVIQNLIKTKLPLVMSKIGFKKSGRHYVHPECKHLFVEFPPGPLGIGTDSTIEPHDVKVDGIILKILSPTDCIKDRLASYIHFKTEDALDQAVLVANAQPFDLNSLKIWCRREGSPETFKVLIERIKKTAKKTTAKKKAKK
jgi:hypothetical protein